MIDGPKPYPKMKDSGVPWLGEVPDSVKTGYEIRADSLAREKETERLLDEIIAGAKA